MAHIGKKGHAQAGHAKDAFKSMAEVEQEYFPELAKMRKDRVESAGTTLADKFIDTMLRQLTRAQKTQASHGTRKKRGKARSTQTA